MAGHSKWANIKRRKGKADAIKGKLFSRLTKEIITAVRQGGPDVKQNLRLKIAVQKARDANLPRDTIERNIKKASSPEQVDFVSILYELYGYGGVGILVEVVTDNKNRIASEIRIATNKRGGAVATPGAVSFNFDQKGLIYIASGEGSLESFSEEELFAKLGELEIEDFDFEEGGSLITTAPEKLYLVKEQIEGKGLHCESATLERVPKNFVSCSKEDSASNEALIEWLDEIDDVEAVYHNMRLEEPN